MNRLVDDAVLLLCRERDRAVRLPTGDNGPGSEGDHVSGGRACLCSTTASKFPCAVVALLDHGRCASQNTLANTREVPALLVAHEVVCSEDRWVLGGAAIVPFGYSASISASFFRFLATPIRPPIAKLALVVGAMITPATRAALRRLNRLCVSGGALDGQRCPGCGRTPAGQASEPLRISLHQLRSWAEHFLAGIGHRSWSLLGPPYSCGSSDWCHRHRSKSARRKSGVVGRLLDMSCFASVGSRDGAHRRDRV